MKIQHFRRDLAAQLLTLGALLPAGCVSEESEPTDAPADAGCVADQRAERDGTPPRDCFVSAADAEPSTSGSGIAYFLVDDANNRLDAITLSAGQGASVGAWVGGYGVDGLGCPYRYSAAVVPDPVEGNRLNFRVSHEYAIDRACGAGLDLARITAELPALSAGAYVLRLATGGCLDLQCYERDPERPYLDVPVTVVP